MRADHADTEVRAEPGFLFRADFAIVVIGRAIAILVLACGTCGDDDPRNGSCGDAGNAGSVMERSVPAAFLLHEVALD